MPRTAAFASLLVAWPSELVLHEDPSTIAVAKPHGMIVHGGADTLEGDVVSRLQEKSGPSHERSRWRPCFLVDRAASGVLLLTRSAEAHREFTAAGASRKVRWRYVAAVRDPGLVETGSVPGSSRHERPPVARFRVVARSAGRALLELETEAPPPHRLCEALARMSAPVLGDTSCGGGPSHRLMLHAFSLEVPGLPALVAPLPAVLRRATAVAAEELPDGQDLRSTLLEAGWRRRALATSCSVYRLVNDLGDGLSGVSVDRYGDWAVLSLSTPRAFEHERALADALIGLGARGVYVKRRLRADLRRIDHELLASELPLAGEPAPERIVVHEGELRYVVRLGGGLATGLYPDQRDNRRRLFELARDARVLNLFAYSGSFSVAAARAGARTVTSVDLSGRALVWARDNFAENQLDPSAHRFVRADALRWLSSSTEPYDIVVIDPPSFSTSGKGQVFTVAGRYLELAARALARLAPGGRLLAVTHQRSASQKALRGVLSEASRRARCRAIRMRDGTSQLDCPPYGDGPSPSRSVWVTLS